jgi:hypothetical protein
VKVGIGIMLVKKKMCASELLFFDQFHSRKGLTSHPGKQIVLKEKVVFVEFLVHNNF